MNSKDRALKDLIDRHLKWPSDLAYIAARNRVHEKLLSGPAHLQTPRVPDAPPASPVWRLATAAAVAIALAIGAAILWPEGPQRYTAGAAGTEVTLADGSQIEMRARTALTVDREEDGLGIRLHRGDIIVSAAKQRDGHLYVHTKDLSVAVVGTVFLVNASESGSRVTVLEGEVRVQEGTRDTMLHPGEHVSTSPVLASRPLTEDVAWSRDKEIYQRILRSFEQGMAQTAGSLARLADPPASQQAPSAQTIPADADPEFEVASIRACDPDNLPETPIGARGGGANSFYMTPGRMYALCLTLATLVRTAYDYSPMDLELLNASEDSPRRRNGGMRFEAVYGLGVEDGQRVRGGPDWVRTAPFTIEAVAPGAADANTMRGPMLRALLERRFQLKVRIESEPVDAYALRVAPGGFRFQPMQDGDCNRDGLTDAVRAERARVWDARGPVLITEAARLGIAPTCGTVYGDWNGPNLRTEHVAQTPGSVATVAAGDLDVRVVDRTGITDRYVFAWEYSPDENSPTFRPRNVDPTERRRPGFDSPMTTPKALPLRAALAALGLTLEPIRLPREYIVIEQVERPEPN